MRQRIAYIYMSNYVVVNNQTIINTTAAKTIRGQQRITKIKIQHFWKNKRLFDLIPRVCRAANKLARYKHLKVNNHKYHVHFPHTIRLTPSISLIHTAYIYALYAPKAVYNSPAGTPYFHANFYIIILLFFFRLILIIINALSCSLLRVLQKYFKTKEKYVVPNTHRICSPHHTNAWIEIFKFNILVWLNCTLFFHSLLFIITVVVPCCRCGGKALSIYTAIRAGC